MVFLTQPIYGGVDRLCQTIHQTVQPSESVVQRSLVTPSCRTLDPLAFFMLNIEKILTRIRHDISIPRSSRSITKREEIGNWKQNSKRMKSSSWLSITSKKTTIFRGWSIKWRGTSEDCRTTAQNNNQNQDQRVESGSQTGPSADRSSEKEIGAWHRVGWQPPLRLGKASQRWEIRRRTCCSSNRGSSCENKTTPSRYWEQNWKLHRGLKPLPMPPEYRSDRLGCRIRTQMTTFSW